MITEEQRIKNAKLGYEMINHIIGYIKRSPSFIEKRSTLKILYHKRNLLSFCKLPNCIEGM